MKTNELIDALASDTEVGWPLGRATALALLTGAALAAALFFSSLGFRPGIEGSLDSPRFLFKLAFTLALAVMASGCVLRLSRPGARSSGWAWALVLAPVMLVVAVTLEMTAMPSSTWMTRLVGRNWLHCLSLIPLLSLGPLTCLLLALRLGAPERPGLAGALAGLAASGIAGALYATNCTDDSPLFVAVWYPLAMTIVALMGYAVGRRVLKW